MKVKEVNDLITQSEAAVLKNTTLNAVNNWINRGYITGYPKYGKTLVSQAEVEEFQPKKIGRPFKKTMEVNP